MAIWIQSLSWTLIYGLGQGLLVYTLLWLILRMLPAISANAKYHLSLSALTILLAWFAGTWWQQFHFFTLANEQTLISGTQNTVILQLPLRNISSIDKYASYRAMMLSIHAFAPWLSAFYVAGLLLMLMRLSAGMQQLFSLRKNGTLKPDPAIDDLLTSLKNRIHFEGGVQLLISAKAQVPMVIGFLKPIILMPAATMAQLSTEQLETILLHELAHIKRYDYLINILQTVVETILFFNPFVWMISSITRREREHCCDDLVLANTREPLYYATALAALANHPEATPTIAVAASGQSNYLFNRIKRIMEMKKTTFSYSRMVAAILIITVITCSIAVLTPSLASAKKDNKAKKTEALKSSSPAVAQSEDEQLVNRLIDDRMIDQVKGFVVEKNQNKLYIDGQQQPEAIANKYLSSIKQEYIRVQVFPFLDRLKMHPDAGFLQVLLPASLSSPCVDKQTTKKPGC